MTKPYQLTDLLYGPGEAVPGSHMTDEDALATSIAACRGGLSHYVLRRAMSGKAAPDACVAANVSQASVRYT